MGMKHAVHNEELHPYVTHAFTNLKIILQVEEPWMASNFVSQNPLQSAYNIKK